MNYKIISIVLALLLILVGGIAMCVAYVSVLDNVVVQGILDNVVIPGIIKGM